MPASAPSLTCLRLRCLRAPRVPVLVAFGSEPMSLDGAAANPRLPLLCMHISVKAFQNVSPVVKHSLINITASFLN